ncbi:MAG: heparinase II/III family protein, partial [Aristaeellaceae bacterium]
MNASMLLERINLDYPGLEQARALAQSGQADAAADAVIRHFRTRTSPRYLFTIDDMRRLRDDQILRDAQDVLDHTLYGHHFGGEIDWHFNPTDDPAFSTA